CIARSARLRLSRLWRCKPPAPPKRRLSCLSPLWRSRSNCPNPSRAVPRLGARGRDADKDRHRCLHLQLLCLPLLCLPAHPSPRSPVPGSTPLKVSALNAPDTGQSRCLLNSRPSRPLNRYLGEKPRMDQTRPRDPCRAYLGAYTFRLSLPLKIPSFQL